MGEEEKARNEGKRLEGIRYGEGMVEQTLWKRGSEREERRKQIMGENG